MSRADEQARAREGIEILAENGIKVESYVGPTGAKPTTGYIDKVGALFPGDMVVAEKRYAVTLLAEDAPKPAAGDVVIDEAQDVWLLVDDLAIDDEMLQSWTVQRQ